MAVHDQRLKKLRGHVMDAQDELQALPAKERSAGKTGFARLEEVVAYARAVLDAAEARLISTGAFTAIQSAACVISNSPRSALRNADACADALLDAVALLPVRGRGEIDQEVDRAAAEVQRDAAERLDELRREVESERQRVRAFRSEADELGSALQERIDGQAAVERKLAELDQAIAKQGRALDEHKSRLEERLAEIRRMETESAALVGSIGLTGAAELYREQGRRQRRAAGILRGLTVVAALAAAAVAVIATVATEPTTESLVGNLFASALLAGLAAYFARQSERHRAREGHASALHLELVAFTPFIEALSPEQRAEERVVMTRKLFGNTVPGMASLEDHAATERARAEPSWSVRPVSHVVRGSGARSNGHVRS